MPYSTKLSSFAGFQCKREDLSSEQIKYLLYYHWNNNKNQVIFIELLDTWKKLSSPTLLTVWLLKQGQWQWLNTRPHGKIKEEPGSLAFQLSGLSTRKNHNGILKKSNCFIQFEYLAFKFSQANLWSHTN